MVNYLTIDDFESPEMRRACKAADTNNSGGIDTDAEFKKFINSIHSDNPQNYCPAGHVYEGKENEIELVHEAYDKYKNDSLKKILKEYQDFISKNKNLEKIFGKSIMNIPNNSNARLPEAPVDKRGLLPIVPDKSNDTAFDVTEQINNTNDRFIPAGSDLGKQIGRETKEFRPELDGKYKPVYSEPDVLGRREIIGYVPRNIFDVWN